MRQAAITRTGFTYGYWLNGWRKNADDSSPDVLCIETGSYGLVLDIADLQRVQVALLEILQAMQRLSLRKAAGCLSCQQRS